MEETTALTPMAETYNLPQLGALANMVASQSILEDYRQKRATQTLRRQKADIALFTRFLAEKNTPCTNMYNDLQEWKGVTWGLVAKFLQWQLEQGYAIGSINVRLATIKAYCQMARKAKTLDPSEYALIIACQGYNQSDGRNVDEKREKTRRTGSKKAEAVSISTAHAELLKRQPDTRKGRRDVFLVCLLLEHGLRCGEIADLNRANFDLKNGRFTFYRHKVGLTQTHNMTPDTLQAAQRYWQDIPDGQEPLFVGICSKERIDERSINSRIEQLGKKVGLPGLSPHDGRHFWATDAVLNETGIKNLQDAGGWKSPAMPLRYVESCKIANEGVRLSSTKKYGEVK